MGSLPKKFWISCIFPTCCSETTGNFPKIFSPNVRGHIGIWAHIFISFRRAQDFRNNRQNEGNFSAFLLPIRYSLAKPLGRANAIALQIASCRHESDFDTVKLGLHLHCNKRYEGRMVVRPRLKVMPSQKPLLMRRQTLVFAAMNIFTSNDKTERWSRIWLLRPTSMYRWRHYDVIDVTSWRRSWICEGL